MRGLITSLSQRGQPRSGPVDAHLLHLAGQDLAAAIASLGLCEHRIVRLEEVAQVLEGDVDVWVAPEPTMLFKRGLTA